MCSFAADCPKRRCQLRGCFFQFRSMGQGKFVENALALFGERHQDLAAIIAVHLPGNQAHGLKTVHEPHSAVRFEQQTIGEMSDSWRAARGHAFQSKESLMLLRLDVRLAGRRFAEMEEAADLKTEFFESPILGCIEIRKLAFIHNLSYHDIFRGEAGETDPRATCRFYGKLGAWFL
jgi:hypothetical protein